MSGPAESGHHQLQSRESRRALLEQGRRRLRNNKGSVKLTSEQIDTHTQCGLNRVVLAEAEQAMFPDNIGTLGRSKEKCVVTGGDLSSVNPPIPPDTCQQQLPLSDDEARKLLEQLKASVALRDDIADDVNDEVLDHLPTLTPEPATVSESVPTDMIEEEELPQGTTAGRMAATASAAAPASFDNFFGPESDDDQEEQEESNDEDDDDEEEAEKGTAVKDAAANDVDIPSQLLACQHVSTEDKVVVGTQFDSVEAFALDPNWDYDASV